MEPPAYEEVTNKPDLAFYIQDELKENSNELPTYEEVVQVIPPYSATLGMRRNASVQFCLHV